MSDVQHPANAQLHALGEAYQHGRIGRDEYRARRRDLLAAVRGGQGVTHRNAIRPVPSPAPARPGPPPTRQATSQAWRRRLVFVVLVIVTVLAVFLLLSASPTPPAGGRPVNVIPSAANHQPIAVATTVLAAAHGGDARQGTVSGEIDECV
ncbi:hypothetical protein ACFOLC_03410 [Lysobacter cavernae]|uniref:SHOCT domain-containing protein n=1 Tax=Lysobacter cavernae TaxID=1685901 RepID=A0ABV7RQ31_9GAMM